MEREGKFFTHAVSASLQLFLKKQDSDRFELCKSVERKKINDPNMICGTTRVSGGGGVYGMPLQLEGWGKRVGGPGTSWTYVWDKNGERYALDYRTDREQDKTECISNQNTITAKVTRIYPIRVGNTNVYFTGKAIETYTYSKKVPRF